MEVIMQSTNEVNSKGHRHHGERNMLWHDEIGWRPCVRQWCWAGTGGKEAHSVVKMRRRLTLQEISQITSDYTVPNMSNHGLIVTLFFTEDGGAGKTTEVSYSVWAYLFCSKVVRHPACCTISRSVSVLHCHPPCFLCSDNCVSMETAYCLSPSAICFFLVEIGMERGRREDSGYAALIMTAASCTDSLCHLPIQSTVEIHCGAINSDGKAVGLWPVDCQDR